MLQKKTHIHNIATKEIAGIVSKNKIKEQAKLKYNVNRDTKEVCQRKERLLKKETLKLLLVDIRTSDKQNAVTLIITSKTYLKCFRSIV